MWSLGTLIAFPLCALVALLLIGFGIICWLVARSEDGRGDSGPSYFGAFASWLVALIILAAVASPIGMYPYKAAYHRYEPKSGTVAEVNKRLVGDSSSLNQKFVVRFKGGRQEYGCEDTRCALIHPGDRVTLSCIKQWVYAGADGYNCKFGRNDGRVA